jgi:hypothetical protein
MLPPTMARQSIARLNETTTIVTRDYSPYSCGSRPVRLENEFVSASAALLAETRLAGIGAHVVARVPDSERVTDLALALSATRLAVIRCVDQTTPADHTALATMISQGDFVWGAVVYSQGEAPASLGSIECFHVSQLDQLVARLNELREASR